MMSGLFDGFGVDIAGADDDPFGLPDGDHKVVISDVVVKESSKGTTGLQITFSDPATGKSVSMWNTIPVKDDPNAERNASYLKMTLRNLGVPEDRMNSVRKEDLVGQDALIRVRPQKNNPDYKQISVLSPTSASAQRVTASADSFGPPDDDDPGVTDLDDLLG